jgi:hypothetical protein
MNEEFPLPLWAKPESVPIHIGRCRLCGGRVGWVFTMTGKRAPINPDGGNHFATCTKSDSWPRPATS